MTKRSHVNGAKGGAAPLGSLPPMDAPARVEIEDVGVSIGPREMLAPVSATVEPGRCLAVRGDNGTGKTTLLRVVAGAQAPSTGEVRVAGRRVDARSSRLRRRLGGLLGPSAIYPDLTVYEHLLLVDASWGGDPATVEQRVDEVLDGLTISGLADRFVTELSSGQRQLADIALVLFRPADLLVLDEPEQRLDEDRRRVVAELLRERVRSGTTMLLATHDPLLAEIVADDELVLRPAEA